MRTAAAAAAALSDFTTKRASMMLFSDGPCSLHNNYSTFWLTFLVILSSKYWISSVDTISLAPVYWNSTNPIFKISKNDHIVDVKQFDDIDFVCPFYHEDDPSSDHEQYVIYRVSKAEYDSCNIYGVTSLMVLNCSSPQQKRRFTILFEPFQSIPNVPEYKAGHSYYFISASTGRIDGLSNLHHGACYYYNMKLTVRVCCNQQQQQAANTNSAAAVCHVDANSDDVINENSVLPSRHASLHSASPNDANNWRPVVDGNIFLGAQDSLRSVTSSPRSTTPLPVHRSTHRRKHQQQQFQTQTTTSALHPLRHRGRHRNRYNDTTTTSPSTVVSTAATMFSDMELHINNDQESFGLQHVRLDDLPISAKSSSNCLDVRRMTILLSVTFQNVFVPFVVRRILR